jgi:hypothetical protein
MRKASAILRGSSTFYCRRLIARARTTSKLLGVAHPIELLAKHEQYEQMNLPDRILVER